MAKTRDKGQGRNTGMKKTHEGYRTSLRLRQQVAHLEELLQQHQKDTEDAQADHMLLAHAVVMYKVVHHFLQPLYRLWLQSDPTIGAQSNHALLLSQLPLVQSDPNWECTVQLAASSSSLTRHTLMVTPETVRAAASMSAEGVRQMNKECATRLIFLSELLAPARYSELLAPAQDVGVGADALLNPTELTQVTESAEQLLSRLQEYQALMDKVSITMSVLLASQPQILLGLSGMNMETGEQGSPPARHFLRAANRLRLTSWQVKELQRIRQLLHRITAETQLTGMQLLGMSADSFSLQASLSGAAPTAATSSPGGSTGSHSRGGSSAMMGSEQAAAAASGASSQHGLGGSSSEEEEREVGGVTQDALEQLVQRHMRSLGDLIFIEGNWVSTVLTPWQHGMFMAACWPFANRMGALVELAPFLTPHNAPPLQINGAACPAAAAAAALGAELGYVGADVCMQRRRDALEAQLEWILQECMLP